MDNLQENKTLLAEFKQLAETLFENESKEGVAPFVPTAVLYDELDLQIGDEAMSSQDFNKALTSLILKTPRTATNKFFNQLFGGRQPDSVLGELMSVLLNNSMYTYKAAGPQVGVEKVVIKKVIDLIGWDANADGTFAPGGSLANFMGMIMARDACDHSVKANGTNKQFRIYTSATSHYSLQKNASFAGIGRDNVVSIPVNKKGEMIALDLEKAINTDIKSGATPLMVNATLGTTVLGAFDNLNDLSNVCQKYKIWLHADGAYCGAVFFSKKYKHLMDGIEKVDSFCFNAHKMLGTPLSSSLIFAKNGKYLHQSFANDADYLYQTDGDEFNLGKMSLQCGRRNDALKLWTLWKSKGTVGLEKIIDQQFTLAQVARDYIISNHDYILYSFDDSISVCFNYKQYCPKKICTLMYEQQKIMVGYGDFNGNTFIRLVTINPNNSGASILSFFKVIEDFAVENHAELFSEDKNTGNQKS